ncbi:MAG: hypothetical protein HW421_2238 [Ignavibacteria bacterium]|nr:hypothetical protein [Ignavibacteria bacterium]
MNTISIPLSEAIYSKVKEISEKENISIENFASSAVTEKLAVFISAKDFFKKRLPDVTKEEFEQILAEVPDIEPPEYDKL